MIRVFRILMQASPRAERLGELLGLRAIRGRALAGGCLVEWYGPDQPPLPAGAASVPVGRCLGSAVDGIWGEFSWLRDWWSQDGVPWWERPIRDIGVERLASLLEQLRREVEAAGRDWRLWKRLFLAPEREEDGPAPGPDFVFEDDDSAGAGQVPEVIEFPGGALAPAVVKLGTDPEFELISLVYDEFVLARDVIEDPGNWPIGTDGTGCQVEFRPGPGTAAQVVENLRELFCDFGAEYLDYCLVADGDVWPLGAHIHVSVYDGQTGMRLDLGSDQAAAIVLALDSILGEGVKWSGRARGQYAQRQAWRPQPHGLEYRTLPACVLATPELALAVFEIAGAIVAELVQAGEFRPAEFWERAPEPHKTVWERFIREGPPKNGPVIDVLYNWGILSRPYGRVPRD